MMRSGFFAELGAYAGMGDCHFGDLSSPIRVLTLLLTFVQTKLDEDMG